MIIIVIIIIIVTNVIIVVNVSVVKITIIKATLIKKLQPLFKVESQGFVVFHRGLYLMQLAIAERRVCVITEGCVRTVSSGWCRARFESGVKS